MKNNVRDRIFTLIFLLPFQTHANSPENIWANSPLGKCYKSTDDYLAKSYGADFSKDENLSTYPLELKNKAGPTTHVKFMWVADMTTGVNFTRVLFRVSPDKGACAILLVPLASQVEYQADSNELPKLIQSFDSPPPGYKQIAVTYKLNSKLVYDPFICTKTARKTRPKKVPCFSLNYD